MTKINDLSFGNSTKKIGTSEQYFFHEIVMPTVADFNQNPGDLRRGVLACVVLQSMNEHYFKTKRFDQELVEGCKNLDEYKLKLRENDWSFGQIMDVANGAKHAKRAFFDLNHAVPAECGTMRAGFPLSSEPYVFLDAEQAWLLCDITNHVAEKWAAKLISE